jgi:hypothetical protein
VAGLLRLDYGSSSVEHTIRIKGDSPKINGTENASVR